MRTFMSDKITKSVLVVRNEYKRADTTLNLASWCAVQALKTHDHMRMIALHYILEIEECKSEGRIGAKFN